MARRYAIVIGFVLIVAGTLGIFGEQAGIAILGASLASSDARSITYIVTGLIGLVFAFAARGRHARLFAQACGPTYIISSVLGFARIEPFVTLFNVTWTYNTIHLAIGLFGLLTGFGNSDQEIRARIKSYRHR